MDPNLTIESNSTQDFNVSELLSADLTSKVPKVSFLLLFGICGIVGSGLLLLVLLRGKKSVMGVLIINLCLVGLCECWLNMTMVFGALVSDTWIFGDTMCKFNAFCMAAVFIELVLTLLCITIERFISMKHCIHPKNCLTIRRILFLIIYTWIHSITFSIPLLIGSIPTTYRPPLHLCSVSNSSSLTYICLTSVICFIIPIITMLVLYVLIIRYVYKKRHAVQTILAQNQYTEKQSQKIDIQNEINMSKYGGVLLCVWFLLGVPYIITAYIRQYQYSYEFQKNNFLNLVDYPWSLDVTFVYLRFLYSIVFPVLTFFFINYLWVNLKDFILCRRNNSISDIVSSKNSKESKKQNATGVVIRGPISASNNRFFNVPVLFATSDGIHIETYESDGSTHWVKSEEKRMNVREKTTMPIHIVPKGKTCDVGPVELDYSHQDTSDYDSCSETDVFSSSQPVSMKQVSEDLLTRRSISQPEVHQSTNSGHVSLIDVKQSFATDSGLDLSVTGKEHSFKTDKRNKFHTYNGPTEVKNNKSHGQDLFKSSISNTFSTKDKKSDISSKGAFSSENLDLLTVNKKFKQSENSNCEEIESSSTLMKRKERDLSNSDLSLENYVSVSQRVKNNETQGREFPQLENCAQDNQIDDLLQTLQNEVPKDVTDTGIQNSFPELTSKPDAVPKVLSKPLKANQKQSKAKSRSACLVKLGETFNIPATTVKNETIPPKGHKRHDTSDSQKSLLGSGSSCELASMKASCFQDNTDDDPPSTQQ